MVIVITHTGNQLNIAGAVRVGWASGTLVCFDRSGRRVVAFLAEDVKAIAVVEGRMPAFWDLPEHHQSLIARSGQLERLDDNYVLASPAPSPPAQATSALASSSNRSWARGYEV